MCALFCLFIALGQRRIHERVANSKNCSLSIREERLRTQEKCNSGVFKLQTANCKKSRSQVRGRTVLPFSCRQRAVRVGMAVGERESRVESHSPM